MFNYTSKHKTPGKSCHLLETLSDVHAGYIENARLSTPDRYAIRTGFEASRSARCEQQILPALRPGPVHTLVYKLSGLHTIG